MKIKVVLLVGLCVVFGMMIQAPRAVSKSGLSRTALPAAPRPDLAIIKVTFTENKARVRLKNIGEAASTPCQLSVALLDGHTANSKVSETWIEHLPALAVGRDIMLTVSIGNKSFSGRGVLVTLDHNIILTEVTRSNNTYFKDLPKGFNNPADLAASSVEVTGNEVIGIVKNISSAKFTGKGLVQLTRTVKYGAHQNFLVLKSAYLLELNPGAEYTLKAPKPKDFPGAETYIWRLTIDAKDNNGSNDTTEKRWKKFDNN